VKAEPAIRAIASRLPGARREVQAPRPLGALARTWRFADAVLPVYAGARVVECPAANVARAARQTLDGSQP